MSESVHIQGTHFAKGSSRARTARLTVMDRGGVDALLKFDDGSDLAVRIASVSDRIGGVERRVELTNGSVFTTADNDAVDRLGAARGGLFSRVSALEAFRPRLIAFVAAAGLLAWGLFQYGLPVAVQVAVWATPSQVADVMDTSARASLERIVLKESNLSEARKAKLRESFDMLVAATGSERKFDLIFRGGGAIGANALALPGGTVVLTDEFVQLVSHEQAVAVMAHELAHVTEQHSLRQIYRALGFAALVAAVTGDLGTAAEEIIGGGGLLVTMASSREMELEADAKGVALLHDVGKDPAAMSTALDAIYAHVCGAESRDRCEASGWLSTHPGGAERREALEREIESVTR